MIRELGNVLVETKSTDIVPYQDEEGRLFP